MPVRPFTRVSGLSFNRADGSRYGERFHPRQQTMLRGPFKHCPTWVLVRRRHRKRAM